MKPAIDGDTAADRAYALESAVDHDGNLGFGLATGLFNLGVGVTTVDLEMTVTH